MQTDNIPASEIQVDDWFFLAGTLFRVVETETFKEADVTNIRFVDLTNEESIKFPFSLAVDSTFQMQILNQ